jgi:hypothetical protein
LEQLINPSYVVNPTLYSKVPHEFEKDFNLVSLAVLTTLVIVVHPSVPAHTVNDLVGLIKANPGRSSYASPRTGTPGHLVGETFRLSQGLDLVHVPFNSAGLAVGSAVAGHTPICFASPSPAAQQVIEGKLRGLAGDQQVAFTGTAGPAYHRGGGLSGRRWRQLAGYCRPGWNAETDHRFPSSRDRRYHGTPRHQGAPRCARLRAGREHEIAGIAAILMLLSTNLVFAQANPNQGATSSSQSNEQQRERSVPGNPNNPGPR